MFSSFDSSKLYSRRNLCGCDKNNVKESMRLHIGYERFSTQICARNLWLENRAAYACVQMCSVTSSKNMHMYKSSNNIVY